MRKLHRYLGLFVSLFIFVVTVTGVLLLNFDRFNDSYSTITTAKQVGDSWLVGTDKGVFRAQDLSFEDLNVVNGVYSKEPVIDIVSDGGSKVCVGFKFGSLYCSSDYGRVWKSVQLDSSVSLLNSLVCDK